MNGIVTRTAQSVRLFVKAKPGASRARPPRLVPLAEGGQALEIAVTAPPEDGKANKALLSFLASSLALPKAALSVKSGASSRLKLIEIQSDNPAVLEEKLRIWLHGLEKKRDEQRKATC